jgi:hypothetical protein
VQVAARVLGLRVVILHASRPSDIELAFTAMVSEQAGALVVSGENSFSAKPIDLSHWRRAMQYQRYFNTGSSRRLVVL